MIWAADYFGDWCFLHLRIDDIDDIDAINISIIEYAD
jgi:hypothetical protein